MSFHRESQTHAAFERRLLESARKDAPPSDAQDAWTRFAGALGPLLAGSDSGQRPGRAPNVTCCHFGDGRRQGRRHAIGLGVGDKMDLARRDRWKQSDCNLDESATQRGTALAGAGARRSTSSLARVEQPGGCTEPASLGGEPTCGNVPSRAREGSPRPARPQGSGLRPAFSGRNL